MLPNSPIEQISRELFDLGKRIERLERLDQVFTINPTETVINEAGIDRDLRVEGNTEPNLFVVNAGTDRVGIGTNAPIRRCHVIGPLGGVITAEVSDASTNGSPGAFSLRHSTSAIPIANFGVAMTFEADDETNVNRTMGSIRYVWSDPTPGTLDSVMIHSTVLNSVNREIMRFSTTEVVFNNLGLDLNFRVEGDTETHLLFADAGRENVGIKTNAPNASASLDISGTDGSLLIPRMTTAQRNALAAVNGMGIYNTTTNQFEKYQAGAWIAW